MKALIALRRSGEERRAGAQRRCVDLGRSGEPAPGGAASISGGAASQRSAAPRRSGEEPRAGSRRRCVDLGRSDGGAWNGVGGAAAGRRRNGGR